MTLFNHAESVPGDREKMREGYEAARSKVALSDLSHIGKFLFKGPDRHKFLHSLLTEDVSACFHAFYLVGPKLFALLEDLGDIQGRWPLPSYGCREVSWRGAPLFFLSYPSIAPEGILVLCPPSLSQELWTCFLNAGRTHGLRDVTSQTLEVLRVESGKPLFGVDMDGENLPLEVNLEEAISFSKGCYLGQETTARVKNRGHVNRRLVGLKISGSDLPAAASLSRGSPIFLEGQAVGTITSVVESPRLKSLLALALIRQPQDLPGTRLEVSLGDRRQVAEVVAFPLSV